MYTSDAAVLDAISRVAQGGVRTEHPTPGNSVARPRRPGWLILGAAGRNAGKTEFACAIIRAFHRAYPIVGVKITAVPDTEEACPRGGEGCGACAALRGDFLITEERGEHPGKDTARLLASGARRVFWVRCRRSALHAAQEALAPRVGQGELVVVESNSLAQAIEPDLFFMVRNGRERGLKPTAAEVLPLARRTVVSSGEGFDLDLRRLAVVDGTWHLVEASAAILAGGKSSRMGQDKSLLVVEGQPLIQRIHRQLRAQFDDILVSTNDPAKYGFLGARAVPDREPGQGPLGGIASAVEAAIYDRVFVVACDIPVVPRHVVTKMLVAAEESDCVIARSSVGHEPLFSVYRKSALPAMRAVLDSGERRISALFSRVRIHRFDLGVAPWYRNLNTQDDLAAFLQRLPSPSS
jgi:molybdenum cofactor guanylyltransferase